MPTDILGIYHVVFFLNAKVFDSIQKIGGGGGGGGE